MTDEQRVLAELAGAAPLAPWRDGAEPNCWSAAAANDRFDRTRAAAPRLRWWTLARRAIAASWPILDFTEFAQSYADALAAAEDPKRRAPEKRAEVVLVEKRRKAKRPAEAKADDPEGAAAEAKTDAPEAAPEITAEVAPADAEKNAETAPEEERPAPPEDPRQARAFRSFERAVREPGDVVRASSLPKALAPLISGARLDDAELWRQVRATPATATTPGLLAWDEVVRDLWPRLWGAYGARWRRGV
mmetsp:Transcript_3218/g.9454  ORF Transcript_3218/g.9454 Transcript_3218/m.9454 type:complete len:247 (-) Transcript_3218:30-770(-)